MAEKEIKIGQKGKPDIPIPKYSTFDPESAWDRTQGPIPDPEFPTGRQKHTSGYGRFKTNDISYRGTE